MQMQMVRRSWVVVILAVSAILVQAERAEASETLTLKNGIKVVPYTIDGSSQIHIITYVPMGFCGDEKDHAQWCHLIEHLVSSHGHSLPFSEVNAETLSNCMHLDYYSRPASDWREGVALHASWLSLEKFTDADVKREIPRVLSETESLANGNRSGKFAVGAWAQAVRFGRSHVAMLGDVRHPGAKDLFAYYKRNFLAGSPPVIAVSGKFDRDALIKTLEAKIGTIKLPAAPQAKKAGKRTEHTPVRITWDLPSRHLMFYWQLPDLGDSDSAALLAAAGSLMASWYQTPADYRPAQVFVNVEGLVRAGGHRYLLINIPLKQSDEAALKQARKDALNLVGRLFAETPQARMMGRMQIRSQYQQLNQIDLVIAQAKARNMPRGNVEGGVAVLSGMFEFLYRGKMPRYVEALGDPDDSRDRRFLQKVPSPEKRHELLIVPE